MHSLEQERARYDSNARRAKLCTDNPNLATRGKLTFPHSWLCHGSGRQLLLLEAQIYGACMVVGTDVAEKYDVQKLPVAPAFGLNFPILHEISWRIWERSSALGNIWQGQSSFADR
uniref:Uncharacterized protein n=1 Tax=Chrysotila carterae TaxID=13221 RepID=A0A7S4BKZ8_CHRCT